MEMRVVSIAIDGETLSVDGDKPTSYRFTERFWNLVEREDRDLTPQELESLGKEVFFNIFSTRERKERLNKWLEEAREGTPLVFKVESDSEKIHNIPFELICNDEVGFFLKQRDIHMVRDIPAVSKPIRPVEKDALRMLFILSLPLETYREHPLDPLEELNVVYGALCGGPGLVEIDVEEKASLTALERRFGRKAYDIIHFSGHGASGGHLVMEDDEDQAREKVVSLEEFSRRVYLQNPVLYFLDACQTARSSPLSPSLAYHLYRSSPRAVVIANVLSVYDHLATEGAKLVYQGLLEESRPGLMLKDLRISLQKDWWKPVIFAANPDRPLFLLKLEEREAKETPRVVHLPAKIRVDYVYRYPLVRRASDLIEVSNHLVLHGVGGSGKSILAGYLARFFRGRFPNVLFMDLREYPTPLGLLKGMLRIMVRQGVVSNEEAQKALENVEDMAPEFALDELLQRVMGSLRGRLFLVLDNLEGVAQERDGRLKEDWRDLIAQFLTRDGLFLVLASRLKVYRDDRNPLGNTMTVGEYTGPEVGFLLNKLLRAGKIVEGEYLLRKMGDIEISFGRHPLAIAHLAKKRPEDVKSIVKDEEFRGYLEFYREYFDESPQETQRLLALEYPFSHQFLEHLVSIDVWSVLQERLGVIEEIGLNLWRVSPVIRTYFAAHYPLDFHEMEDLKEDLMEFWKENKAHLFCDALNIFDLLMKLCKGSGDRDLEGVLIKFFNSFSRVSVPLPPRLAVEFAELASKFDVVKLDPVDLAVAEQTLGEILAGMGKREEGGSTMGRLWRQ